LLQREKGRDLLDLSHAMSVLHAVNVERLIAPFLEYLIQDGIAISRAQAEERMWNKLDNPGFLSDTKPLLSADAADELTDVAVKIAFARVMTDLIALMPGNPWARSSEMAESFGVSLRRES
jgi:hypothetical protein